MGGILLGLIAQLIGIAMVTGGILLPSTGSMTIKLLSAWLLLSGTFTLMIGYLFIRVALGETYIRKRVFWKILHSFFSFSSFI